MEYKKTKYVFVIVVYRNTLDLENFIKNIASHSLEAEFVIVNNYYDEKSKIECEEIANKNSCRFLNIKNNGYGYGNNRGIEYANINFEYDFLIVSNADIEIEKFDESSLDNLNKSVLIGPLIKTANNKNQNPYWFLKNKLSEWLIYQGYKKKKKSILYIGIILNKLIREIALLQFSRDEKAFKKVFALHGCFVIFSPEVFEKIPLPYDEDMFLFAEEAHLAHLLEKNNIDSYITKAIRVKHKEDGSMTIAKIDEKSIIRESVILYYEKLKRNKIKKVSLK